ncbi:glycosyltransferase family 39 protein [Actinopolymorpha singaporensis]|uniref:Dolichyl-phosphate-mannose-protein mannosyltransferase n=1 Tax=Actinopolymorpha singaporensis TaxID=117157 RepID=A0A1H1RGM9_9ACTN|nr:glycosyltransferase family 39 protein [Actinopolymorpha singaporensis]SDS34716.1 Dolichyl-phosphate-mannose-protein mannosyltransferase [Actinopolymorpha singaporensis]
MPGSQRLRARVGLVEELVVWAAVLAGIVARVDLWWQGRAFWRDELALVQSLDTYPPAKLLGPLSDTQSAPPGWLLLERLVTTVFGTGERAYRLIPLLAGCATLVLVALLARRFVRRTWTAAIPVLALATLPQLVFYSAQAKQYTTDMLLVTGMLLLAVGLLRPQSEPSGERSGEPSGDPSGEPARWRELGWYALIAVGPWFSHGFMLAAPLAAAWVGFVQWRRGVRSIMGLLVRLAAPGVSLLLAALWARHLTSLAPDFASYWMPFMRAGDRGRFLHWNRFLWEDFGIRELGFDRPWALVLLGVPAVGLVAACVRRWSRSTAPLLVLPLFTAYAFALVSMYPFGRRLVLFCVPGALVLAGVAVDAFVGGVRRLAPSWTAQVVGLAGVAALGLVAWTTPASLDQNLRYQYGVDDYRVALQFVKSRWKPGDVLVTGNGDRVAFRVYGRRLGLPADRAYRGMRSHDETKRVGCPLPKEITSAERVWLVTGDRVSIYPGDRSRYTVIVPFLDRYRRVYFADRGHVTIQVLLPGPAGSAEPPKGRCLEFAPVGPPGTPARPPALPID